MTEDELRAKWESLTGEQIEEMKQTATRIGTAVRILNDQRRADPAKAAEFNQPWVLVDRLGIPRDHVSESSEKRLRECFWNSYGDCSVCQTIVLAVVLTFVVAIIILLAFMCGQIAPPIATALMAAGLIVSAGAVVIIAETMTGLVAETVGLPVCTALGFCAPC